MRTIQTFGVRTQIELKLYILPFFLARNPIPFVAALRSQRGINLNLSSSEGGLIPTNLCNKAFIVSRPRTDRRLYSVGEAHVSHTHRLRPTMSRQIQIQNTSRQLSAPNNVKTNTNKKHFNSRQLSPPNYLLLSESRVPYSAFSKFLPPRFSLSH